MSHNVSQQLSNYLSPNQASNREISTDSSSMLSQPLEASSRQAITSEMDNHQFETIIDKYFRINTQPQPQNYRDPWLQSFFDFMKSEWARLRTYNIRPSCRWTVDFVSPEELANAGFFFLNEDRVQCAFCRGIVSGWEPGDRPLAEHARHFPRCPFIMEEDVGNIPIAHDPIRGPKIGIGHDVCGNYTPMMMDPVLNSINPMSDRTAVAIDMREYGVQPHRGPKNPDFKSIDTRRRSFQTNCWDSSVPVSIKALSEAGFFSIGMSDYVKCFYCDGGLCNWEEGDDPWVEHAKWFPDCEFVRLNKSSAFVEQCKKLAESSSDPNHTESTVSSSSSDQEVVSINGSDSDEEFNEDTLGLRVVNEWMNSDIVIQLIDLNAYSIDIIKAALNRRWHEARQPFSSFAELYDAVSQSKNHPVVQNSPTIPPIPQDSEISDDQSSGDDEYHSNGGKSSSQSSKSSTISSLSSTLSSSPPSSLESAYSDSSTKSDDNRLLCKICLDREIGVVFLPCGHQLACTQCAPCIVDCPICRKIDSWNC